MPNAHSLKIIGIDPALHNIGWGVIECHNNNLKYIASGVIKSGDLERQDLSIGERLLNIHHQLSKIILQFQPQAAAMEQVFINSNSKSSLRLSEARGAILLSLSQNGLPPAEYSANRIKKTVCGNGHAGKSQIIAMIGFLLPNCDETRSDACDALSAAICHWQFRHQYVAL